MLDKGKEKLIRGKDEEEYRVSCRLEKEVKARETVRC